MLQPTQRTFYKVNRELNAGDEYIQVAKIGDTPDGFEIRVLRGKKGEDVPPKPKVYRFGPQEEPAAEKEYQKQCEHAQAEFPYPAIRPIHDL